MEGIDQDVKIKRSRYLSWPYVSEIEDTDIEIKYCKIKKGTWHFDDVIEDGTLYKMVEVLSMTRYKEFKKSGGSVGELIPLKSGGMKARIYPLNGENYVYFISTNDDAAGMQDVSNLTNMTWPLLTDPDSVDDQINYNKVSKGVWHIENSFSENVFYRMFGVDNINDFVAFKATGGNVKGMVPLKCDDIRARIYQIEGDYYIYFMRTADDEDEDKFESREEQNNALIELLNAKPMISRKQWNKLMHAINGNIEQIKIGKGLWLISYDFMLEKLINLKGYKKMARLNARNKPYRRIVEREPRDMESSQPHKQDDDGEDKAPIWYPVHLVGEIVSSVYHMSMKMWNKLMHSINGNMLTNKVPSMTVRVFPPDEIGTVSMNCQSHISGEDLCLSISAEEGEIWDQRSYIASLIENERGIARLRIPKTNPYKMVHEIVSMCLCKGKTDVPLMSLVEPPYRSECLPYLRMTPDFILKDPLRIIEIGTTLSRDEKQVLATYRAKLNDTMEKCRGAGIRAPVGVIIISPQMVVTNYHMAQNEVDLLISIFLRSQALVFEVCDKNGLNPRGEELSLNKKIQNFKEHLPELYQDHDDHLIVTTAVIGHWENVFNGLDEKSVISNIFRMTLERSKMRDSMTPMMRFSKRVDEFPKNYRGSRKSPCQIPFLRIDDNYTTLPYYLDMPDHPYRRLWESVISNGNPEMEVETLPCFKLKADGWKQSSDRKFSRVSTQIIESDLLYFSQVGLFGRKYKHEEDNIIKRSESKVDFGILDYTDDIDDFIKNFEIKESGFRIENDDYLRLIMNNRNAKDFSQEVMKFYLDFLNTNLGSAAFLITLIGQELNNDIIKKNTSNQLIYKRIANYNIWYIARPTGTHLFYSILTTYDFLDSGVFKLPVLTSGRFKIFEFVSTDSNRVSTMLNCFENLCVLYSDLKSRYPHDDQMASGKLKFSMLMMIENKQVTADSIYNWRQMYMKATSGSSSMDPGIMLKKTEHIRSRLGAWVMKQSIEVFSLMMQNPPKRNFIESESPDDEGQGYNNDSFDGLYDVITGKLEERFENCIYSSYLACYHSTGTMSKTAAEFKVVAKIVKYELMLRDSRRERMGVESHYEWQRPHEFNLETSMYGGMLVRRSLESVYGSETDSMIWQSFFNSMKTSFMNFATYKSSVEYRDLIGTDLGQKKNKRAIETVMSTMGMLNDAKINPFDDYKHLFSFINEPFRAKIDKKTDQLAGLREILTMWMMNRYLIKPIELTMEWVNSHSKSEILSKGSLKEATMESFNKSIDALREEGFKIIIVDLTIDHSKWCQLFIMKKFLSHLYPILPRDIHRYFCHVLNSITQKRIYLSSAFTQELFKNFELYDSDIAELRAQFLGKSDFNDLIEKLCCGLKNRSNMGQGWLQNLSSSDGDADMQIVTMVCQSVFSGMISSGQLSEGSSFHHYKIGSSDDQAQKMVYKVLEGEVPMIQELLKIFSLTPVVISNLNNKSMNNEKSELEHLQSIIEFNQIFESGNNKFVGIPKLMRASLELAVTTKMVDRFLNFSNTRRNMLESGCDMFTVSVAQMMQAHLHYRSMGMFISRRFPVYSHTLIHHAHPILGYFVSEPETTIGLAGYDYALYHWMKIDEGCSRIANNIMKKVEISMGASGKEGPNVSVRVVKTDKFSDFRKNFVNVSETIEEIPELLYRKEETREETFLLLNDKGLDPSAELAFTYDMTPKVMQLSSYLLSQPVMKYRSREVPDGPVGVIASTMYQLMNDLSGGERVSDNDMKIIFPEYEMYERIYMMSGHLGQLNLYQIGDLARQRSTINFDEYIDSQTIPLIDCVKQIWFSLPVNHNSTLVKICFEEYKKRYIWLRDTHEMTLNDNKIHFSSAKELNGMIESLTTKRRQVRIFSPLKNSTPDRMISNILRFNWKRGMLNHRDARPIENDLSAVARLCQMSVGPFSEFDKLSALVNTEIQTDFNLTRSRNQRNIIIAQMVMSGESPVLITNRMKQMKDGMIGMFIKPQKLIDGIWSGDCSYLMSFFDGAVRVEIVGKDLQIHSYSRHSVIMNKRQIIKEIAKMGWSEYVVSYGTRLLKTGITSVGKEEGYRVVIGDSTKLYSVNLSNLRLSLHVNINGKFEIKNDENLRTKTSVYSFYLDSRVASPPQTNSWNPFDKWCESREWEVDDMELILIEEPIWLKTAFNLKLQSMFGTVLEVNYKKEKDIIEMKPEEMADLMNMLSMQMMIMEMEPELRENIDDQENLWNENMDGMNPSDMAYVERSAEDVLSNKAVINNRAWNKILRKLDSYDLRSIYLSPYKLNLEPSRELDLFKVLTDYDKRPSKSVERIRITLWLKPDIIGEFRDMESEIMIIKEYTKKNIVMIGGNRPVEVVEEGQDAINKILSLIGNYEENETFGF